MPLVLIKYIVEILNLTYLTIILFIISIYCVDCQCNNDYHKYMNKDTILKLGIKIRIERQKRKMSQEKLAELADVTRNYMGLIERGETNITIKNLENIANALEIPIEKLFDFVI